jgi:hypothetical protein
MHAPLLAVVALRFLAGRPAGRLSVPSRDPAVALRTEPKKLLPADHLVGGFVPGRAKSQDGDVA